jgi:UDP-2,3-diacylglucosamine pyrophosphatase LpxH
MKPEKTHYRTIVISDLHMGSKGCKARLLNDFLKNNSSDYLYLNGDIFDCWKIQQNKWHFNKAQSKVLRRLLKISMSQTQVIYILGNHDDFFRNFIPYKINLGKIKVLNECVHVGQNGARYLVTHGDLFDTVTRVHRWISFLGDRAYDYLLRMNGSVNSCRRYIGLKYWSLSHYLKTKVKKAVDFIFEFETTLSNYAKSKSYNGIICGHIHVAEIKNLNGIVYMNSGDWVESCTALVETIDGDWQIIHWHNETQLDNNDEFVL